MSLLRYWRPLLPPEVFVCVPLPPGLKTMPGRYTPSLCSMCTQVFSEALRLGEGRLYVCSKFARKYGKYFSFLASKTEDNIEQEKQANKSSSTLTTVWWLPQGRGWAGANGKEGETCGGRRGFDFGWRVHNGIYR